jgi:hypothetical protein
MAVDAVKPLWSFRPTIAGTRRRSLMFDGKQYVAVAAGSVICLSRFWSDYIATWGPNPGGSRARNPLESGLAGRLPAPTAIPDCVGNGR